MYDTEIKAKFVLLKQMFRGPPWW